MPPDAEIVNAPLVTIPQFFGTIVFERSSSRYLPFDAETTALLRQSLQTPFPKLIAGMTDPDRRNEAIEFYRHFYERGFFTPQGRFRGRELKIAPAPNFLTAPLAVHLEIVAACNLACSHCFAGALPRREKPLSMAELESLFASMAGIGSFRLGLTGGEPLLRKDLFEMIDMALAYGLHPCITTNGLLLTEDIAREFGRRNMVWINVSLEGATAVSNDRVRGAGVFDRVMENLKSLSRHARFTLAFTILRDNAPEVVACAKLAESVGASTAVFRPLYPVGVAKNHLEELMPSYARYHEALESLCSLSDSEARVIDPFSPQSREETRATTHLNHGCGAGNSVCSISVSGDVSPCSFLGEGFANANVRETPLEEIWRNGNTFREIRALPGGRADTFSGGCRARSLALNGSINAPDPWVAEKEAMLRAPEPITLYHPSAILRLAQKTGGS